ncbi:MAG: hypothetical protein HFI72_04980 [Peptococcaceae bacterium]|jgi:hypothetical protein|nr:hypothetical protein [Peptococcaceae bacterium]
MVNEIIKSIRMKLSAAFGDGYEIYEHDFKQGLTGPCFFISIYKSELSSLLGQRAMRKASVVIHYVPLDTNTNGDILTVAEELLEMLQLITLQNGDMLRGTGIRYEIAEGRLQFFIDFHFPVITRQEESYMSAMDIAATIGKGGVK